MAGKMAHFGHDVAVLMELQAKLLTADLKQTSRQAMLPCGIALFASALVLGCFPVLLMGIAYLLIGAGMGQAAAFLLTALGGVVVSGLLLAAGWMWLKRSGTPLKRSQEELSENLRWIKTVLKHSGRPGFERGHGDTCP